jgi:colanic acid/amylovoran biosynthesis glycosyltransferase
MAGDDALRIGVLVHAFPVLSETFVTTLAASLARAGHDVAILATDPAEPQGARHDIVARAGLADRLARARTDGRLTHSRMRALARQKPSRAPLLAGLLALDRIAPTRLAVTRLMAEAEPFDIVHAQFGYLGLTAARHRRWGTLRTRALVVHLRGHDISGYVQERGPLVYARLFREADLFIANCGHFRDRAIALGCPPDRIVVVGSPIETGAFAPPGTRAPYRDRPLRLVAVGRLVEKKGFADAIAAVAILAGQGRDVRLDILGDGELRPDLERLIAGTGMGDRVRLHGAATQAQVIAALHAADIALAPSVTAASGDADAAVNTAKEAMATGLPVVATDHGGIPELVLPGETGALVPERDPPALAAAIARLMDDPAAWPAMGRAGRHKVVTEYDHAPILAQTLDAYRSALVRAGERA